MFTHDQAVKPQAKGSWRVLPMADPRADESALLTMRVHGEAVRTPTLEGSIVFSHLSRGASRILALAPSVRYVLDGEETYTIGGRSRRIKSGEFLVVDAGVDSVARVSGE